MRRIVLSLAILFLLELLMTRQVNAAAMAIANQSEGCVLRVYKDAAGVLTAGWGHVGKDLPPLGTVITQAQADAWRAADMARAAAFVEEHVDVTLTDNQFSALAEFTFNIGTGAFLGSTLLRKLNKKQFSEIPNELMRWTKAKGKVLPGLVARRQKEVALWNESESITALNAANDPVPAPNSATAKPTPPSLIERIRAWFHRNAQVPA